MTRILETLALGVVAALALFVSILDLAGALDGVDWLKNRVAVLTLLAVGAVLTHLTIIHWTSQRELDDALKAATEEIREAVHGIVFRELEGASEYWEYAAERIGRARSSVDDVTWGEVASSQVSAETKRAYKLYRRRIGAICTGRGRNTRLVYREMMSFPDGYRLGRARDLLNDAYPNYHLRYFDFDHDGMPPLLQFFVIDRKEVLLSVQSKTAFDNKYISIVSPRLAEVMCEFFELAWRDGIVLKDARGPRFEIFAELEARFPIVHQ